MLPTFSIMEKAVAASLIAAAAVVAYLLLGVHEADEDWEAFKAAHHCIDVGVESGSNRGGWRCDDGKVHHRWRQQK
ncbi:hypothetical protein [Methylococcus sp. EFPC2]|uniref:hypothetical protein n=1 Tax=Methylococcus sp. EFPC2 TaxID=2812648 RepID=UPI001967FB18|nr:hypothetical protein [Methylococcus sp. EFPC2]QSA95855.1 hypothetical protein JWZ97_11450 [Methylococcus sp. EFPC2]